MLNGAAKARGRDVKRSCSSLVQFDFDKRVVSVCQLCLVLFPWILDIWSKTSVYSSTSETGAAD